METIGLIFDTVFFAPIVNLLILVFKLLQNIGVPGALGLSIAILTIVIRILIWPFTASQVKSIQKMASLKPFLDELKLKHKGDKKAFGEAQMALFKEHGVNPAGGCLPTLIQLPIFIALYQAILNVFPGVAGQATDGLEKINSVLYSSWLHLTNVPDPHFLGFSLASRPSDFASVGAFVLIVPVLTGVLTFIQSKMMMPVKPISHHKDEKPKETKEKEGIEDAMASVQGQMVYMMPLMIGYFAFQFPIGLAIYWNTFTIMGIVQQYRIAGWGGLNGIVKKFTSHDRPS